MDDISKYQWSHVGHRLKQRAAAAKKLKLSKHVLLFSDSSQPAATRRAAADVHMSVTSWLKSALFGSAQQQQHWDDKLQWAHAPHGKTHMDIAAIVKKHVIIKASTLRVPGIKSRSHF